MKRAHVCAAIGTVAGLVLGATATYAVRSDPKPGVEQRTLDAEESPPPGSPTTDTSRSGETVLKETAPTHPPETEAPAGGPPAGSPDGGGDQVRTAAASRGWQLVASEDFEGSRLDTNRWTVYDSEGNAGVGWRRPEAISVSDGTLKITGRGDVSGGMNWQGGRTHGRWEIRARNDAGNGYAPNLLLWPTSGNWPTEGEINIMEIPAGDRSHSYFVLHWGADNSQTSHLTRGDFTRWHTFAVEWLPTHITLFVDGEPVYTNDDPTIVNALRHPMHLSIQNDVGPLGDWIPARDRSTPPEVSLEVDWVRIYAP